MRTLVWSSTAKAALSVMGLSQKLYLGAHGDVGLAKFQRSYLVLVAELISVSYTPAELRRASGRISDIISLEVAVEDKRPGMAICEVV